MFCEPGPWALGIWNSVSPAEFAEQSAAQPSEVREGPSQQEEPHGVSWGRPHRAGGPWGGAVLAFLPALIPCSVVPARVWAAVLPSRHPACQPAPGWFLRYLPSPVHFLPLRPAHRLTLPNSPLASHFPWALPTIFRSTGCLLALFPLDMQRLFSSRHARPRGQAVGTRASAPRSPGPGQEAIWSYDRVDCARANWHFLHGASAEEAEARERP